jgi:hypothetical protein
MEAQGVITLDQDTVESAAAAPISAEQELQTLTQLIRTWRDIDGESRDLKNQIREKAKRQKALEEMILRIMKKHNIGALDLKGSGARLLYRRSTTKETLNMKNLATLLSDALKSPDMATNAIKYITEHRGSKVRESLFYEKE